jgi:beta-galactosidase
MTQQLTIDGRITPPPTKSAHLNMGGCNPAGSCITVNNRHLLMNGKPWLPVVGEFHYSRYPRAYWEEAVLKMKAAGVSIVASYIFWIHHEEVEGEWEWSRNRALHDLVELCARHDLYFFARIGPWSHGEVRNGGFPDWLARACPALRQDDPTYLGYVRRLFEQIWSQVSGTLFKEGGPIIGIQLENEYGHVGQRGHPDHILTLKRMAIEIGFDVPLYTVTGWGGAWVPTGPNGQGEVLPVLSGYPAAPWTQHTRPLDPVPVYLFQQYANDPNVGSDLAAPVPATPTLQNARFSTEDYPYLTAETGGGNQVTRHRRPLLSAEDVAAIPLTQVGSGANLMGYYVFHGGTNPVGKRSTLQESRATGYPNDLPVLSYDFQAPIREYGQLHGSYRQLKLLHLFLQDFGKKLAPLVPVLPEHSPASPGDACTLRAALRTDGVGGFLFINNHQRGVEMQHHRDVTVRVPLAGGEIAWRSFDVEPGASFIWPFNLELEGARLIVARAQPVCRLAAKDSITYVFAATPGVPATYAFDAATVASWEQASGEAVVEGGVLEFFGQEPGLDAVIDLRSSSGAAVRILTLDHAQALNLWKGEVAGEPRLVLTSSAVMFDRGELVLTDREADQSFWLYPDLPETTFVYGEKRLEGTREGLFMGYRLQQAPHTPEAVAERLPDLPYAWRLKVTGEPITPRDGVEDIFLRLHIACDSAHLYLDNELIADTFYTGEVWEVGLKRFAGKLAGATLKLVLLPLWAEAAIYLERTPAYVDGMAVHLERVEAVPEYVFRIRAAEAASPL